MKDFSLTEIFCEILSGFLAISVTVLILDCFGYVDMIKIKPKLDGEVSVLILLLISYFAGLIIDAIGLGIGELKLDKLVKAGTSPSDEELKIFYSNASEGVMKYRDSQWTYYSLYRNIFIVSIIGYIFFIIKVGKEIGWPFAVASGVLILGILWCFFRSMKALLTIYYKIPKSVVNRPAASA